MSRSRRFVIGLLCVAMAMTTGAELTGSHDAAAAQGDRERFVGAWRLAWLEEPGADGHVHRADCTGLFVFTRDGYASVQGDVPQSRRRRRRSRSVRAGRIRSLVWPV
jgi:hypothetical protein